jgi:hypothetical protein
MSWTPEQIPKGYEKFIITCDGCGRKAERVNVGNDLVGRQHQLVCGVCRHRGATLLRTWCLGSPPGEKKAGPLSEPGQVQGTHPFQVSASRRVQGRGVRDPGKDLGEFQQGVRFE